MDPLSLSDSRVPQTGINAFGQPILPLMELAQNARVRDYLVSSITTQFSVLALPTEEVRQAVVACLDVAAHASDVISYEREAYRILNDANIVPEFTTLTSGRAERMCQTIAPYLISGTVLDLGCGPGKVGELLSQKGFSVDLADVYKHDHVAQQLSHLDFTLVTQNAPLPFEPATFDNVLVFAMLHHTTNPLGLLSDVHRILASGGRLHLIETVYGLSQTDIKPLTDSSTILDQFVHLSEEEQRLATMFLDYFGNHVTWYFTTNPRDFVPVPFNFNTPQQWPAIFESQHFVIKEARPLGIDPSSGVFHYLYVLEKNAAE